MKITNTRFRNKWNNTLRWCYEEARKRNNYSLSYSIQSILNGKFDRLRVDSDFEMTIKECIKMIEG
jgi:hypothetical protein